MEILPSELRLPCPFCGELPAGEGVGGWAGFRLGCQNSKCLVRPWTRVEYGSTAEAVDAWNTRTVKQFCNCVHAPEQHRDNHGLGDWGSCSVCQCRGVRPVGEVQT